MRILLNLVCRIDTYSITTWNAIKKQFMVNASGSALRSHCVPLIKQNADILKEFVSAPIKFIVEPIQQHELLFVVDKALDAISVEPSSLTTRTIGGTHINLWLVSVRVHQRQ